MENQNGASRGPRQRSRKIRFRITIIHPKPVRQKMTMPGSGETAKSATHFAAVIESTWIVLVLSSSVPMTLTFCAANFSGVFWSLSV